MTTTPNEPVKDEDIETVGITDTASQTPGDADGTDTADADGTDGDSGGDAPAKSSGSPACAVASRESWAKNSAPVLVSTQFIPSCRKW